MLLNEVEPDTRVTVRKIMGGADVKDHLRELGIVEGVELTVISTEPVHVHAGPILLKVDDNEVVIARGWADKVHVASDDETVPLLHLEAGDHGTVTSVEGGKEFEKQLSGLGIKIGKEVGFVRHLPDDTMVFMVGGNEVKMGEGMASKVLVASEKGAIQLNQLKVGEKTTISGIIGGVVFSDKMNDLGVVEGAEIELIKVESGIPGPVQGRYVTARVGDRVVTIGHGTSEKIEVE
ncbi:MAG: FeoA family protein [Candidatus Syntropharchaeales archaeon]